MADISIRGKLELSLLAAFLLFSSSSLQWQHNVWTVSSQIKLRRTDSLQQVTFQHNCFFYFLFFQPFCVGRWKKGETGDENSGEKERERNFANSLVNLGCQLNVRVKWQLKFRKLLFAEFGDDGDGGGGLAKTGHVDFLGLILDFF